MKCSCDFNTHSTLGAAGPPTFSGFARRCGLPRYVDHGSAAETTETTETTERKTKLPHAHRRKEDRGAGWTKAVARCFILGFLFGLFSVYSVVSNRLSGSGRQ